MVIMQLNKRDMLRNNFVCSVPSISVEVSMATREQNLFSSTWERRSKGGSANISNLWGRRSPNFWTGQSRFLSSNCFFECEHRFIDKPMVATEPALASAWLLGLDSKLYPSNIPRMLNKYLTRFVQSLYWVRQNRANERKALLIGWFHVGSMIGYATGQRSRSRYTCTCQIYTVYMLWFNFIHALAHVRYIKILT